MIATTRCSQCVREGSWPCETAVTEGKRWRRPTSNRSNRFEQVKQRVVLKEASPDQPPRNDATRNRSLGDIEAGLWLGSAPSSFSPELTRASPVTLWPVVWPIFEPQPCLEIWRLS